MINKFLSGDLIIRVEMKIISNIKKGYTINVVDCLIFQIESKYKGLFKYK